MNKKMMKWVKIKNTTYINRMINLEHLWDSVTKWIEKLNF